MEIRLKTIGTDSFISMINSPLKINGVRPLCAKLLLVTSQKPIERASCQWNLIRSSVSCQQTTSTSLLCHLSLGNNRQQYVFLYISTVFLNFSYFIYLHNNLRSCLRWPNSPLVCIIGINIGISIWTILVWFYLLYLKMSYTFNHLLITPDFGAALWRVVSSSSSSSSFLPSIWLKVFQGTSIGDFLLTPISPPPSFSFGIRHRWSREGEIGYCIHHTHVVAVSSNFAINKLNLT